MAGSGKSKVIRNSAECLTCDAKLESTHRHDFQAHVCPNNFHIRRRWVDDKLVDTDPPEPGINWFIDGGKEYIRQGGSGFKDTSILA